MVFKKKYIIFDIEISLFQSNNYFAFKSVEGRFLPIIGFAWMDGATL